MNEEKVAFLISLARCDSSTHTPTTKLNQVAFDGIGFFFLFAGAGTKKFTLNE